MTDKNKRRTVTTDLVAATFGAPALQEQMEEITQEEESQQREEQERRREQERKTKITRHERDRRARMISLTFPSPEWKEAVQEQAEAWGLGQSDFLTYCVAHTMAGIQRGNLQRPETTDERHEQSRTGSYFDLPWEPED